MKIKEVNVGPKDMSEEEWNTIKGMNDEVIGLKQQPDGSFRVMSDAKLIPLTVVNEMMAVSFEYIKDKFMNDALKKLPKEHLEYTASLLYKIRWLKRLNFLFYALTLIFLLLWMVK